MSTGELLSTGQFSSNLSRLSLAPSTPDKPIQRLIIQKIVLKNFKSYAGEQVIGPFHKSFTSIIGPNGSGKSNVIDAIQFVFGKRGTKLRMKKLQELIHKSEEHPNCSEASVTVHFCDILDLNSKTDEYKIVEGSTFYIRRTVKAKGSSKYFINSSKSSFQEVTDLLKKKGIDLTNNRFLILQGEVEQISLMKPRAKSENEQDGLLEYIEDIIGTHQYKKPIEEEFAKVEELTEDRTQFLDRVKHAETERNGLEQEKTKAEEYILKQMQLCELKYRNFQFSKFEKTKKLEEILKQKEKIANELSGKEQASATLKEEIDKLEAQKKEKEKEKERFMKKFQAAEKKYLELDKKFTHMGQEKEDTEKKVAAAEEKKAKIEKSLEDLEKSIKKMEKDKEKFEKEKENLEPNCKEAETVLEQLYTSIQEEIKPYRKEIEQKKQELLPIANDLKQKKQQISVKQQKISFLEKKTKKNEEDITAIQNNLESNKKQLEEIDAELKKKSKDFEDLKKTHLPSLFQKRHEILGIEAENDRKMSELLSRLQQSKDAIKECKTESAVLKVLMEAKADERIEGIHDRLGNLGTIDAKYDVAISTACKGLDDIVVETSDSAKKCVEELRTKRAGVATFFMLDKLLENEKLVSSMKYQINTPENVPRLFDLIKPKDEKFKISFYSAIRDTLVADNLEQATRIAYGQSQTDSNDDEMNPEGSPNSKRRKKEDPNKKKEYWRVVTLKGELIDASGTISGGGNKILKGRMSSKATRGSSDEAELKKEILALEKDIDLLKKQIEKHSAEKSKVNSDSEQAKRQEEILKHEIPKMEMDKDSLSKSIVELTKNLKQMTELKKTQKKEETEALKEIESLKTEIEAIDSSMASNVAKEDSLKQEISELEQKIENGGDGSYKKQKSKSDSLKKELEDLISNISKNEANLKAKTKKLESEKKKLDEITKEFESETANVAKLEKDTKELVESSKPDVQEYKALKLEKEKQDQTTDSQSVHYNSKKKEFSDLECEIKRLRADLESLEQKIKENNIEKWDRMMSEQKTKFDELSAKLHLENEEKQQKDKDGDEKMKDKEENEEEDEKMKKDLAPLTEDELVEMTRSRNEEIAAKITVVDEEIKKMKPTVNTAAIEEYQKKHKIYLEKLQQLEEKTKLQNESQKKYLDLKKKRLEEFMHGFSLISMKLKEIYRMITIGGDAELELVDNLDPFTEGIELSVRPPKKSWKKVTNLSGGEKTLSSLALVFALHHYKPTPIYVMDEIDAALDFKNVSIVGNYIKESSMASNAQFIVISLRSNMFEMADILVGIYKTQNATKSVTVWPKKIQQEIDQEKQEEKDEDEDEEEEEQIQIEPEKDE